MEVSVTTSSVPDTAVEIRLASRPEGWPTTDNFDIVEAPVPEPGPGQLLVRNKVMSVDPYMRGRMSAAKSYVAPFEIGQPLDGGAVGEVVRSNSDDFSPGQSVLHSLGWREYAVVDATQATAVSSEFPPSAFLGVLGMPGMTAYVGLMDKARFQQGDTVFVSGAAGAVGSLVGQLAKLGGAERVIGSAGSPEKVRLLTERFGFDAAFNYKDAPVGEQLRAAAPNGIDVYFDNVGGDHLEAAIGSMNDFGRIAACGAISQYNATEAQPGPRNMFQFVTKRLSMQGFIVNDNTHLKRDFFEHVAPLVREGRISYEETSVDGIRKAPEAFLGVLRGDNTGKMLVNIA
ncbi:NADP-dependent oxidoreductase [Actinopolyspora mortivallis]|uniref:NADP-dependent oxidoreductase n=1 Tax=Actinopolyspora mortivallis TaxID=33906 RepID=A0A2T0GX65_ACTMO|nr:NADP-dependent oxidoreductase [Actinopolyspora mortivallis]